MACLTTVVVVVNGIVTNAAVDLQTPAVMWEMVMFLLTHDLGPRMRHLHWNTQVNLQYGYR